MNDSFSEVTSVSWFRRIGRSFGGVLFGLLLIVAMVVGLFWNEGRAVTTARSLDEGRGAVVPVAADRVATANEGRLVHLSGAVATEGVLRDPEFGVAARAIRLVRSAEMFQWNEEKKSETRTKLGGSEETVTTYSYVKTWDDDAIDSSDFRKPAGHGNPQMRYRDQRWQAEAATLGAFRLDKDVLDRVGGGETLTLTVDNLKAIKAAYSGTARLAIADGGVYLGRDPSAPAIGDIRIRYEIAPLGPLSIVGMQAGEGLRAYQTRAGDRLLLVDRGTVPADQMFKDAVAANTVLTWVLRVAGLLLLALGFALAMGPVAVLADVIPFLGSLVRAGTGIVAVFLAVIVGTVVIAVAWFWYRPLLAAAVIVCGFAIAAVIARLGRARSKAAPAPA
jgi:hypothetical protein